VSADNGRRDDLYRFFREAIHVEVPGDDTDLLDEGLLDSLGLVELVLFLEHHYAIALDLTELDLAAIRTPSAILRLIADRQKT